MNQNIKKYFFYFCVAKIYSCVSGILTSSISLAAGLCLRHMSVSKAYALCLRHMSVSKAYALCLAYILCLMSQTYVLCQGPETCLGIAERLAMTGP